MNITDPINASFKDKTSNILFWLCQDNLLASSPQIGYSRTIRESANSNF